MVDDMPFGGCYRLVSRYCRYEDAVEGHEMTVEKLRRELND